jgi:hypothetical protein
MSFIAKHDILWFKQGQTVPAELILKNPNLNEHVDEIKESKPIFNEVSLDLNKDGKVDSKDSSLASKVLNSFKSKKKRK